MTDPRPVPTTSPPPPAISVIVRSVGRPTLQRALDSVAAQDVPGVEVRVVAASGPAHGPLPATAGAHPVHRVDAGCPLRRSAAANAGLDAAAAHRVIFLDDDDVFLPGHLSRLSDALDAQGDAVLAYADVELGRYAGGAWVPQHVFGGPYDPVRLRFENHIPLHAALVDRRRGGARSCRFDVTLDLFEDWDWWLQLSRCGGFAHVAGVSARYVAADGAGSGVFADDAATAQVRRQLLQKWLDRDGPDDRQALLQALGQHYRDARQRRDELALALRTEADLRAIVEQRDADVRSAAAQLADLRALVQAREAEIAAALQQIESLRQVLAAREREVADGAVYVQSLREVIDAREAEIAALRRTAAG